MARSVQEAENRRLQTLRSSIEAARDAKVQASREEMERSVRRTRSVIRTAAVLLRPVPMIVVGLAMFLRRHRRESATTAARSWTR